MQGKELREALFILDNSQTQQLLEEKLFKREEAIIEFYEKLTEEKLQLLLDEC